MMAYDDDLGNVVLSAIRYALPRKTSIIDEHIRFTQRHWDDITDYWRGLILRDCQQAMDDNVRTDGRLGVDSSAVFWVGSFVDWMVQQGVKPAR